MTPTSITVIGNLVREPDMKAVSTGQFVCKLTVAANRRVVNRAAPQEKTDVTSYYDVVAFGALADNVGTSLHKGTRVVITGRLDQRCWIDEHEKRHYAYEIVADEVGASLRFATAEVTRAVRRGPLVADVDLGPGDDELAEGEGIDGDDPHGAPAERGARDSLGVHDSLGDEEVGRPLPPPGVDEHGELIDARPMTGDDDDRQGTRRGRRVLVGAGDPF